MYSVGLVQRTFSQVFADFGNTPVASQKLQPIHLTNTKE